jgi:hypothetical protein
MKRTPRLAHFVSLSIPSQGEMPAARQSRIRGISHTAYRNDLDD